LTVLREIDLFSRGVETLLASWAAYARGASGASLQRLPGVAAAVFPHEPERAIYNNALLERDLEAPLLADAVHAMQSTYAAAGIERFAAWVHDTDLPMRTALEARGYTLDTATRAMGLVLDDIHLAPVEVAIEPLDWHAYLHMFDLPPDLLSGVNRADLHVLAARVDGTPVAAALAFDHDGDCGIYNVGTVEHARGRGLATALTVRQLHDARERGCQTASLQSTEMAERVYAAAGFRDLGRFLEYVPPHDRRVLP